MKQVSEQELAAYLDERDRRLYSRLLLHRFFQGTVRAVQSAAPVQVQVQRVGETTTDPNWYACPGFTPHVGQLVQLVWLDNAVAIVMLPISG